MHKVLESLVPGFKRRVAYKSGSLKECIDFIAHEESLMREGVSKLRHPLQIKKDPKIAKFFGAKP